MTTVTCEFELAEETNRHHVASQPKQSSVVIQSTWSRRGCCVVTFFSPLLQSLSSVAVLVSHMTLTLRSPNIAGMDSVAPSPVAIQNMDAMIKVSQNRPNQKQSSCRTLGETAMLSETSSTVSLEDDELQDTFEPEQAVKPLVLKRKPVSLPPRTTKFVSKVQPQKTTERQRSSSILKPSSEEIPISLKGKPFKSLPPPDMSKIKTATKVEERPRLRRQHSVGFASVVIREYDLTIGDNPSVSYGPPISLDWDYTQLASVTLEHYEAHRAPRRSLRQMCMNYYTRRNVLTYKFGYTEEQVKQASKQADKSKRERAVTKYFLPYAKVEDVLTSAGRKAKRGFKRSDTV